MVSASSSRRAASSLRVGKARGLGSKEDSRTGSGSPRPSTSSPRHAAIPPGRIPPPPPPRPPPPPPPLPAEQPPPPPMTRELCHLRCRHCPHAVAPVDEHQP